MPTEVALDGRTALIATAMNGSPLPTRHGFPARLIVSGLYGYVSATKWLSRLELTTWEAADGYWIPGDGRKKRQSRSRQGLTYPNAQRSQPGSHQSQGLRSRRRSVSQRYMSASMTARGSAPTSPTQRTTTPGCSGVSDGRQLPAITTFVFAPPTATALCKTEPHVRSPQMVPPGTTNVESPFDERSPRSHTIADARVKNTSDRRMP